MATIVLNEDEVDMLEIEILTHAQLPFLAQLYTLFDESRKQFHIVSKKKDSEKSIRELIEMGYFTTDKVKGLFKEILSVQGKTEDFLLDKNKIQYGLDDVHYNAARQEFTFLYKPTVSSEENQSLRYFAIDLLLVIGAHHLLPREINTPIQLEVLIEKLDAAVCGTEIQNTKKPMNWAIFKRFIKKETSSTSVSLSSTPYRGKTIALPLKASLIDKNNHSIIYPLNFEVNSIGRGSHCNICIQSDSISQEHATIALQSGQYLLKDLGSKNGTFVNGHRIDNSKNLTSGNFIKFGEKEFVFIL